MVHIAISGFYGFHNTGDEAILETMIAELKSWHPDVTITVLSFDPLHTSERLGVNSLYRGWRKDRRKKLLLLKQADLLISGGGGLLQDSYRTGIIRGPLPHYLSMVALAKLLGTKVMFFAQGIGPIQSAYGRLLTKLLANRADFITVRDDASKELLKQLGVTRPPIEVTADIVLANKTFKAMQQKPQEPENQKKTIVLSMRPWFHHQHQENTVAEVLDRLIEKEDCQCLFIPMESIHDKEASERVIQQMRHHSSCRILPIDQPPQFYFDALSTADLVIGMRLHALIFATLAEVPFIGISYDPKVEHFLKKTGRWKDSFSLETLTAEKLFASAAALLKNPEPVRNILLLKKNMLAKEARLNLVHMQKAFFNPSVNEESL